MFEDILKFTSSELQTLEDDIQQIDDSKAHHNNKGTQKGGKSKKDAKLRKISENEGKVFIEDIIKKEREMFGFNKQIQRSGFLIFSNYEDKLKMMDTPLF